MEVSDYNHWQQVLQTAGTQNITGFSGTLRCQCFLFFFFSCFFLYNGRIQGKGLSTVYHVRCYSGLQALKQSNEIPFCLSPARNIVCVKANHLENIPPKHKQVAQVKNKSCLSLDSGIEGLP